jgi:hypothetical protein
MYLEVAQLSLDAHSNFIPRALYNLAAEPVLLWIDAVGTLVTPLLTHFDALRVMPDRLNPLPLSVGLTARNRSQYLQWHASPPRAQPGGWDIASGWLALGPLR